MITTTPNYGFTTIATGDTDYAGEFDTLITAIDLAVATVSGSQKAIVAGSNITVISGTNTITIASTAGGSSTPAILGDSFISVSSGTNTTQLSAKAITGSDGITVVSGSNAVALTGFRSEFVSASGSLQTQIDAVEGSDVDSVNALTGAVVVQGKGTNAVTVEGQNVVVSGTPHPSVHALIGADGITVVSGSNITTISGFRTEFVNASGSLQTQINTNAVPTLTERQVAYGDASNELTSSANLTFSGSGPTMGLGVGGGITATGTMSADTGNFSKSLTVSGVPVAVGKSFCSATFPGNVSTNLAVGDHIKWTTGFQLGSNISLDTTTAYTSAAGASLGRFTLQPGSFYKLEAAVRWTFTSNLSEAKFQWTTHSGTDILALYPGGTQSIADVVPTTFGAFHLSSQDTTTVVFRPTAVATVEVRFITMTAVSSYNPFSFAFIQEL